MDDRSFSINYYLADQFVFCLMSHLPGDLLAVVISHHNGQKVGA